jgi:hypothetical protein
MSRGALSYGSSPITYTIPMTKEITADRLRNFAILHGIFPQVDGVDEWTVVNVLWPLRTFDIRVVLDDGTEYYDRYSFSLRSDGAIGGAEFITSTDPEWLLEQEAQAEEDDSEPDCDDSDDGWALASAGHGTDEDYGFFGYDE